MLKVSTLYNETKDSTQPIIAKNLAQQSGFRSYITFSSAFKNFMGRTVTEWMKNA
jgi:AraC-like DNA-binding protein